MPRPWGLVPTFGFLILIAATFLLVQFVAAFTVLTVQGTNADQPTWGPGPPNPATNGLLLAVATTASALVCTPLIAFLARLRRGMAVSEYLALRPVTGSQLLRWLGITVALIVLVDGVSRLLGRTVVPDFMMSAYRTATLIPLFWVALVAAAPIFEEVLFRGFLFQGVQASNLGPWGAVVITSLVWTLVHVQYDWFELANIFVLGLLLGAARLRTASIYPSPAIHAFINLVATAEVAVLVHSMNPSMDPAGF